MRFALLGPLEVRTDRPVEIRGLLRRTLLARLLLDAGSTVPSDELFSALWGDVPPASANQALYNQIMRLRHVLGADAGRIAVTPSGYLIRVVPGELDLQVFEDRFVEGRGAAAEERWAEASESFSHALGLWRGRPLADTPALEGHPRIRQLEEQRLQALEARITADLNLGSAEEVITDLQALVLEHPLREAFAGQLMLALQRTGRQAEALKAYQSLRTTLVEELGVEPTPAIQDLHGKILRGTVPTIARTRPGAGSVAKAGANAGANADARSGANDGARSGAKANGDGTQGPLPGISQLPADTRFFCGRQLESARLLALARPAGASPAGASEDATPTILTVDGPAGVGKSALAIRAAHRVSGEFPDGRLFLDLHGHTAGIEPLSAAEALSQLLRSLDVPAQAIPRGLDERAAAYRAKLAGTRTLILLENAADTAQIRPLLPSAPGCLIVVTSRRRLTGLDEAHFVSLEPLTGPDAVELLRRIAGSDRVPEAGPAVDELVSMCGGIPLALRVCAARLRHDASLHVEDLVDELRDERGRLDALHDDDRDMTAVFDTSYGALTADEQRMFRHLGRVPGPDFDAFAAAGLGEIDVSEAEDTLLALLEQNLLIQRVPGRYQFHDLVRLYARRLATAEKEKHDSDAAETRLLDYYQSAAHAADFFLAQHSLPGPAFPTPPTSPSTPSITDRKTALTWMRAELGNLAAAVDHAAATEQTARRLALTASLAGFLDQEGLWQQATTLQTNAANAARANHDRVGEANALLALGHTYNLSAEEPATREKVLGRAIALYREAGEPLGEANVLQELGRLRRVSGDLANAAECLEQALRIYDELADDRGLANSMWALSMVRHATGDFPGAATLLERAADRFERLGDVKGRANCLAILGRNLTESGDYATADAVMNQALEVFREVGPKVNLANVLNQLGRVRTLVGDYNAAVQLLKECLATYEELGTRQGIGYALCNLGRAHYALRDYDGAYAFHERALPIFEQIGSRLGIANVVHEMGRIRLAKGDVPQADEFLQKAMDTYREVGDRHGQCEVLTTRAHFVELTEGPREAAPVYREAAALAQELHSLIDEAHALHGAARCAQALSDHAAALTHMRAATTIYTRIGAAQAPEALAYLDSLLAEG